MTGNWVLEMIDYVNDGTDGTLLNWGIIVYGGGTMTNDYAPVITSSPNFSIDENYVYAGTVTATDQDNNPITYSITGSEISIGASSGNLYFNTAPDYETKSTYTATVTASDGVYSDVQNITVNVNNANDNAPQWTSGFYFAADENQTAIGTMSATDPDGDSITYTITGSEISIGASSGVMTFNTAPDYETKDRYTADVTASDGLNSTTIGLIVDINDVNEGGGGGNNAPVATAASYNLNLLPKDQNLIGFTLSGTDADGDSLTYSIVSNPSQGTVSLSGANVTYQTNSGVDTAQTDTFTFKVNDGTADSDPATISVNLKTDPLYQHQWHLHNYGQKNFATGPSAAGFDLNVDTVIANGYTGAGVLVNVVDEGLEIAHADLAGNIVAGSWDFGDQDNDPTRPSVDGDHGTSVAGIINSVGWNNVGGRGVAPEASLIGYNWLDWQGGNTQYESWGVNPPGGVVADIYNLSYGVGYTDYFSFAWSDGYELGATDIENALIYGTTNHRNGLGGLYIKSSGNDFNTNSVF